MIQLKRIYGNKTDNNIRIHVDRLWPKGISKKDAGIHDVTLLFASKDQDHNNAVVLKEHIEEHRNE